MPRAVPRVDGPPPTEPADRGEHREHAALHRWRRLDGLGTRIAKIAKRHRDLQDPGYAFGVCLAIAGQAEEGLEERLGVKRRTKFHAHPGFVSAAVPPTVGNPDWDRDFLARTDHSLLSRHLESDGARMDREPLLLANVTVLCGHGGTGPNVEVKGEQFAPGTLRRLDPRDPLAGHRVLDGLAGCCHGSQRYRSRPGRPSTITHWRYAELALWTRSSYLFFV